MVRDISSLPVIVATLQGNVIHILIFKYLLNIDLQYICEASDTFWDQLS